MASFNLLHGRSLHDGVVDGVRLAEAVRALDADILALQEVDRGQSRSGHLDMTAIAARACAAGEHRFAAAVVGTPGERFRRVDHDEDGHGEPCFGVALISRYPVRSWQVTRLSPAPMRSPVYLPGPVGGGRVVLLRDEPRAVLAAVVDAPFGPLTVATAHLSFVPGWNIWQLRRVVRKLAALPAPRMLLGDLNVPAAVAALATRWRPLARQATYPSVHPRVQLDHVLADPRGVEHLPPVTAAGTPVSTISDHRPLVVDLG